MQIHNDFLLKDVLWYKIGGKAKYFINCETKADILESFEFIRKNSIEKVFVCGLGSNLLFTDDYFDGVVMQISNIRDSGHGQNDENIKITEDGLVDVFAGVDFDDLIQFTFENNLIGLEWAGGLPGTVGGAIRGNAGAFGGETKDNIVSVDILDYSKEVSSIKTLTKEEMEFAYRESLVKKSKNMIVISAKFKLANATDEELSKAKEVYDTNIQYRKDRHPLEYPNCGSTFKNIRDKEQIERVLSIYPDLRENVEKKWYGKVAVGTLIELLGLKGYRVGQAQISEKHALYIVNLGHAKSSDVMKIISDIQQKFQQIFGFGLDLEVEIVNRIE